MTYFLKVNNDSWGRIIRSSELLNYDLDNHTLTDEFTVSFHNSANFEDIMAAGRLIIGQVDTYVLTIEDEEGNTIFTSDDYIRLVKAEINLEEDADSTSCSVAWSRK